MIIFIVCYESFFSFLHTLAPRQVRMKSQLSNTAVIHTILSSRLVYDTSTIALIAVAHRLVKKLLGMLQLKLVKTQC